MSKHSEAVIQWQLERMDYTRDANGEWIEGEATRADAIALLDELDAENAKFRYKVRARRDDSDFPFAVDDTRRHRMIRCVQTRGEAERECAILNAKESV